MVINALVAICLWDMLQKDRNEVTQIKKDDKFQNLYANMNKANRNYASKRIGGNFKTAQDQLINKDMIKSVNPISERA